MKGGERGGINKRRPPYNDASFKATNSKNAKQESGIPDSIPSEQF